MRTHLGAIALLLPFVFIGTSFAVDPSGTWRFEHPDLTTQETVTDFIDIKYDDGKVSGSYRAPAGVLEIEKAKLDGETLSFEINFDANGQATKIVFSGKISGDEITGTGNMTNVGEFPWTSKRDAKAIDPTGTWRWEHEDLQGRGTVKDVLILKNDGGKLSGTYEGPDGKQDVKVAKVEGKTLTWGFDVEAQGQTLTITWKGDVSGDDVNGTVTLGDFGEFPWSAKRDAAGIAEKSSNEESNKWNLTFNMPDGTTQNPVVEIKPDGDSLSATYTAEGQEFPVEDFTTSEDGKFSFTLKIEQAGIVANFSGQADEDTAKGVIKYDANGETGEIDFTAEKAE